jgi:hypothetical protein
MFSMFPIAAVFFGVAAGAVVVLSLITLFRKKKPGFGVLKFLGELTLIVVLPVFGFFESNDPCQEHPFELNSYPTAVLLYLVPLICYFISAYLKKELPPVVLALLPLGLIMGLVYCAILQLHFGAMTVMVVFPVLGLPLVAPVLGFIYLLVEFIALHKYQQEQISKQSYSSPALGTLATLFLLPLWQKAPIALLLCAPILALMQFVLTLFGQAPDSMISMFTESCGFLLSNHQGCSCGGDHYLCSVAANGNKKLVKPVRFGLRKEEKIVVNRQLLIANAFENWMEEHVPKTHRFVRNTYDSMNIPVNKWSKDKRKANVIYILMKPLEWLFLLWLYCFDKKPESRIALQYLPKRQYEEFKKSRNKQISPMQDARARTLFGK